MTDEMTSLRGLLEQSADADVPASMTFPAAHRTKRHSTDRLECVNGEIKRRTDVVGIFPDGASIKRLVGAVLLEQDDEWQLQHRYMTLETMAVRTDEQPTALTHIAA